MNTIIRAMRTPTLAVLELDVRCQLNGLLPKEQVSRDDLRRLHTEIIRELERRGAGP